MIPGERLDPALVLVRPPRENLFGEHRLAHYFAEKIRHLPGPRQPGQIPVDDDTVKTVVNKYQQTSKQACEQLHRSAPFDLCLATKSSVSRPLVSNFQISLASFTRTGARSLILKALPEFPDE